MKDVEELELQKVQNEKENTYRKPLVSIVLFVNNQLQYTKLCVESLYKFGENVDFELITVSMGITEETEEYLNLFPDMKRLDLNEENQMAKAINKGCELADGNFIVLLSNNVIITENSLGNLIHCINSNDRIGMVVPGCNQSSNYQLINLQYNSLEELNEAAKKYNVSNPNKWEERVKLENPCCLIRSELFRKIGGINEAYKSEDFESFDLCFKIRRLKFKLMFAGDTYVHYFKNDSMEINYDKSRQFIVNSKIFYTNFHVEALEDTMIDCRIVNSVDYDKAGELNILCIGATCGATLLQIKNEFKKKNNQRVMLWYLTKDERYLGDLKTICDNVYFTAIEELASLYENNMFDIIIIDHKMQQFQSPILLLKNLKKMMKNDGNLIFFIDNDLYYGNLLNLLNLQNNCDKKISYCNEFELIKALKEIGFNEINRYFVFEEENNESTELIENLISLSNNEDKNSVNCYLKAKFMLFSIKGKNDLKKILIYPGYDWLLGDGIFEHDIHSQMLGVDILKAPFSVARDKLFHAGYQLCTIDNCDINNAEAVIFIDMPKSYDNGFFMYCYNHVYKSQIYFEECMKLKKKKNIKMILIIEEPPFVMPENYDEIALDKFDIILTMNDDMIDNKKYFKYYDYFPENIKNVYSTDFNSKKLLTQIAALKLSNAPGELYSKRIEAIKYFEKNHIDEFDLYGHGWNHCDFKSYKGEAASKLEVLSKYKFCICYENGILNGWITEKLFHCFFAGCVPIYLGAPNITDYIPEDTFIDQRKYKDYEELYHFLITMSEEEYGEYLRNIRNFLDSEEFSKFTYNSFGDNLVNTIEKL